MTVVGYRSDFRIICSAIIFAFLCSFQPIIFAAETSPNKRQQSKLSVRDFEKDDRTRSLWRDDTIDGAGDIKLGKAPVPRGYSLKLPVDFPNISHAWRAAQLFRFNRLIHRPAHIIERLRYDIYIPENLPVGARVQSRLVLKTRDGHWFEALGSRIDKSGRLSPATALFPGWNNIEVNLSHDSPDLRSRGHHLDWSRYRMSLITHIGISVQCDKKWKGNIYIDNVATAKAKDDNFPSLKITGFRAPKKISRYDLAEFSLSVNRPLLNPFRHKEISIDAIFFPPDKGKPISVPAFYYQNYKRIKGSDDPTVFSADKFIPNGPGGFKIRFTPREAGVYGYIIKVRYRSPITGKRESLVSEKRSLNVGTADSKGFVRIGKDNHLYFEFENGDFFFPIGHSFRSPNDPRHVRQILRKYYPGDSVPNDRGLHIYQDTLPKMRKSGINCFELWMCSWWLGIEWSDKWKGYNGLGRYNMEHAWKLDYLVDLAADNGQYINLVIDNHGKSAQRLKYADENQAQFDHEFEFSPYNKDNKGFLDFGGQLFASDGAKDYYRDKLRYIAARWGWSKNIYAFELWSELDLIGHRRGRIGGQYKNDDVREWHKEMSNWLRKNDHGHHIITTHYSGDFQYVDPQMVNKPFIDYLACDAYHEPHETLMNMLCETEDYALGTLKMGGWQSANLGKPFMITEFGGFAYAAPIESMHGDLYGGLWWGWMSRSAGTPLYWWFELIERDNYRTAYAALAKFVAGEDKRRMGRQPKLRTGSLIWRGRGNPRQRRRWEIDRKEGWPIFFECSDDKQLQRLGALLLGDGDIFYAYIYDTRQLHSLPQNKEQRIVHDGVTLIIENDPAEGMTVMPGERKIEVWDCWTGEVVKTFTTQREADGSLKIKLPEFVVQVAIKIKPTGNPEPSPTRESKATSASNSNQTTAPSSTSSATDKISDHGKTELPIPKPIE